MPKELIVTALGNTIEYATTNGKGRITGKRVNVTDKVLRATNEWFLGNDAKYYSHTLYDGSKSYVFHTTDEDKAEQIADILEVGKEEEIK